MKKIILLTGFIVASVFAKAQMISVTGGNLWLHGNQKGFIEAEIMQNINEKLSMHLSGTKVLGGYDMAMVGYRYALDKKIFGIMFSACFMEKHNAMAMIGLDVHIKDEMRIVYNHSTDGELITLGLKIPVITLKHKSH